LQQLDLPYGEQTYVINETPPPHLNDTPYTNKTAHLCKCETEHDTYHLITTVDYSRVPL